MCGAMSKKPTAVKPISASRGSAWRGRSMLAAIAFVAFVVVAAFWACSARHDIASQAAGSGGSPAASAGGSASAPFAGKSFPSQGHAHLQPDEPDDFVYNSDPPTSGPHKELFTDEFVNPSPLPAYVQVHLLEHGNVLLQYNCTCPEIASQLSAIAYSYDSPLMAPNELQAQPNEVSAGEEEGKAVIVAPYPHMKSRIALTAWTRLAVLNHVDKQKIDSFIALYLSNEANASQ
jgi:hypothetical protein